MDIVLQNKPEASTSGLAKRMGLFGEVDVEIFCPALGSLWTLGLGVLRDACGV